MTISRVPQEGPDWVIAAGRMSSTGIPPKDPPDDDDENEEDEDDDDEEDEQPAVIREPDEC
jgi:hypothetical protein